MEDLYIYTGSIAVVGASVGGPAMRSLVVGNRSIPILLMAIGGGGMLVTAGYKSLRTDSEDFTVPAARLLLIIAAACLSLLGTILSAVSGG